MSIEDSNVVDAVGVEKNGDIILTISDHLTWDDEHDHLELLQNKINTYLSFIESGQILEDYPNAEKSNVFINVVCKYDPSAQAKEFYKCAAEVVKDAGFGLRYSLFDE